MSKANLEGRQASVDRPDDYVLGGFSDHGREVVKKTYTSGKPAEKPGFFMGGSGPTVPTGPKRKLRTSWLADSPKKEEPPPIAKPTRKWTPIGGRRPPMRCNSHDGTMAPGASIRKGKKPAYLAGGKKEEKEEEKEVKTDTKEPEKNEEESEPSPPTEEKKVDPEEEAEKTSEPEPEPEAELEPEPAKEDPAEDEEEEEEEEDIIEEDMEEEEDVPAKEAWTPPTLHIRKPVKPTEEDVKRLHSTPPKSEEEEENPAFTSNGECTACAKKDELIEKQKEEIEKLKAEKGELAKQVKKIKGSQKMNKELKEDIFELKQELSKKDKQDANSKGFHKLENKLNTLKMIMDGSVDKNSLEDLQDHVNMLNMILNQDLKKEGMKNVWA